MAESAALNEHKIKFNEVKIVSRDEKYGKRMTEETIYKIEKYSKTF